MRIEVYIDGLHAADVEYGMVPRVGEEVLVPCKGRCAPHTPPEIVRAQVIAVQHALASGVSALHCDRKED